MFVSESAADTLLLAEDDALLRDTIARSLRAEGFLVMEACTARQAIELLQSNAGAVEWLVTDISCPDDCSSLQVAMEYRWSNPLKPIICVSALGVDIALRRLPDVILLRRPLSVASLVETLIDLRGMRNDGLFGT